MTRRSLNGETCMSKPHATCTESIGAGREPGELKHLSSRRKRKKTIDSVSSGERKRKSPNRRACMSGFGLHNWFCKPSRTVLERPAGEGESPVSERWADMAVSRVPRDTRNLVGMSGDHPVRLNTPQWPIAHSTVKERWKGPREGSEREPETLCLQAVEHLYMVDRVLFVERSGELRMLARLST